MHFSFILKIDACVPVTNIYNTTIKSVKHWNQFGVKIWKLKFHATSFTSYALSLHVCVCVPMFYSKNRFKCKQHEAASLPIKWIQNERLKKRVTRTTKMIWTGDGKSVCFEIGISWLSGTGIDFTVENTVDNVYIIARCIQAVCTYVFAAYVSLVLAEIHVVWSRLM